MGLEVSIPQTLENDAHLAVTAIRRSIGQQRHNVSSLLCTFFIFAIITSEATIDALIPPASENITESGLNEVSEVVCLNCLTDSLIQLKKEEDNGLDDRFISHNINSSTSDNHTSGWDEIIIRFNRMSTELQRRRRSTMRLFPPKRKLETCSLKISEMNDFVNVLQEYSKSTNVESLYALQTQSAHQYASTDNNADECRQLWNKIKSQVNEVIENRVQMETVKKKGEFLTADHLNSRLQEDYKRLQTQLDNFTETINEEQQRELAKLRDLLAKEAKRVRELEQELTNEKYSHRNTKIKLIITNIQHEDYNTAKYEFEQIYNTAASQENRDIIQRIIIETYNKNRQLSKKIYKFIEHLPNSWQLTEHGETVLYDLVAKNNDLGALDTSFVLEWNYYRNEKRITSEGDETSMNRIKSGLKKAIAEIVERWANEIVKGYKKNIIEASEKSSFEAFQPVIGDLIRKALSDLESGDVLTRVKNVIDAVDGMYNTSNVIHGLYELFNHTQSTRPWLLTMSEGMYLGYKVKTYINSYSTSAEQKNTLNSIRNGLSRGIRAIVWDSFVYIKPQANSGNLYLCASPYLRGYHSLRRYVYVANSWFDDSCKWTMLPRDNTKLFRIRNVKYGEELYASNSYWNSYVHTWVPKESVREGEWEIISTGHGEDNFFLFNTWFESHPVYNKEYKHDDYVYHAKTSSYPQDSGWKII